MRIVDIAGYLEKASQKHTLESKLAASLVWYISGGDPKVEISINQIIAAFIDSGLKTKVNRSRLITNLAKEKGISKTSQGTFRCGLLFSEYLESEFSVDTEHRKPKIDYKFMEQDTFPASRNYLVKMCKQINGTYEYKFFDGCAVLLRRLMESLLIEVFEFHGEGNLIKQSDGEYKMLNGIISSLGRASFRLARGSNSVIEKVKKVGDNAAHGRSHITRKNDIDDLKIDYRKLISELTSKAQIS